jgi:hypothetical protein
VREEREGEGREGRRGTRGKERDEREERDEINLLAALHLPPFTFFFLLFFSYFFTPLPPYLPSSSLCFLLQSAILFKMFAAYFTMYHYYCMIFIFGHSLFHNLNILNLE